MNRITAIALLSTATFISLGSALAKAQTVKAKIPFPFVVRSRVLPAGTYWITSAGTNLLQIENRAKGVREMSATYSADNGPGRDGTLMFTKYDDQYFLREILCQSANISSDVPASKLEREAQIREAAHIQEARIRNAEQTVAAVR
jgi:hypothetical protein